MVYFLYTYNCIKLEECQSHHFPIHSWSFFLFSFVSDATNFFVYSLNRFVLKKSYIPVVSCICKYTFKMLANWTEKKHRQLCSKNVQSKV